MNEGWLKLHRKLISKPIWHKSTPEQKSILITLLCLANHIENEWEWMGEKFKILPGQFVTSLESIREASGKGISIQNVRSSLERFKKLNFLTYQSTKAGRVVTICNWDSYQYNDVQDQHRKQQRGNKEVTTKKNDENEKEKNISTPEFLCFWNTYNKKVGRERCLKEWKKISESDIKLILDHVTRYVDSTPIIQYRKDPLTYLKGEHWRDEIICRGTSSTSSNKTIDGRIKLVI